MKEEWRDIQGYEGLYQVSNLGRVKSLERMVSFGWSHRTISEKILKQFKLNSGYLFVCLKKDGKGKNKTIHRLVAEAFIPNPDNLPQCNHKDENPLNNCLENLEWCDAKYNCNYGTHMEKLKKSLSKSINKCVIAYKDGVEVMRFNSVNDAGRNGFDASHISKCCRGIYKKHKGLTWKYAS